ncbi:MAG TPA: dihydrodipicolinate synthase family protein, partial [Gemmatimonadales bacterium]|nr:dihydrodipicolinate synthase family protein [Gemmatimonadales bacterium]
MSKQGKTPAGIFPPIPTPFDPATGAFAPLRFRQNIARLLADGVQGIVVSGTTGEAALLDDDELHDVVTVAREAMSDGAWLIAGTGGESTRQTVRMSRQAAEAGADAVLVRAPSYFSA